MNFRRPTSALRRAASAARPAMVAQGVVVRVVAVSVVVPMPAAA